MSQRPNILVVFTDQQRFDTIRALNNPVIRTPNLDRLVHSGVAFDCAYSPSPVCVPARASLHYGQYPATTRCYENWFPMPQDGRLSFMDALAGAGYRTHGIGKCHFTPDATALRGFQTREMQEEIVGIEADDYMRFLSDQGRRDVFDPNGTRGEMYYVPQLSQLPAGLHPTQWIGDRSVAFIGAGERAEQPWMLFSSFIHPHPPFAPPSPWHTLYRAALMPQPNMPADSESLLIHINRTQNRYKYRDQGLDLNLLRCIKAYYYACISFVDFQVGRMLDALEASGQMENTLVIFTSDHGEHLGDYGCFGKRSMHDSCARVPLVVRLPGRFGSGEIVRRPASLVDIAPTILAAAGVNGALASDGVDLADIAAGRIEREAVFSQRDHGGSATYFAVTEGWKYAYSAPDDMEFLFDRTTDPRETRNLAGVTFRNETLGTMRGLLLDFLRERGEEAALNGADWRRYPPQQMPRNPDAGLSHQDPPGRRAVRLPGYSD